MAIIGLKPGAVIPYIPIAERGYEEALNTFDRETALALAMMQEGKEAYSAARQEERKKLEPCTIHIKYLSNPQVRDYSVRLTKATRDTRTPEAAIERGLDIQRQQFIENVVNVENYSLPDMQVTTAEQLYDNGEQTLIREILQAMEHIALLTAGQRKNLPGPSATA